MLWEKERRKSMSQSSLVDVRMLTSHFGYPDGRDGRCGMKIDKIFVHHMAGVLTVEQCGGVFKNREASAHYGIDGRGRIGQYVLEENVAWHTGNYSYNCRSIGIELSNSTGASGGWKVSDTTIQRCIDLIVDICKRNKITKLNYTGDLKGNLCMHTWVSATACPGPYLKTKFKYIAEQVNKKLESANRTSPVKPVKAVAKKKYSGTLPTKTIKRGSTGKQVEYLQKFLNWYGNYALSVDGDFGPATDKALKKFQKAVGIDADGIAGPITRNKMKMVLK